jgi:adenine-specific DNA-methyltransferase
LLNVVTKSQVEEGNHGKIVAINFDWQPVKPFTPDWQDYRTHKDRSLKAISDAAQQYPASGKYLTCVKVVDTFGCDTSITIEVEV